MVEHRTPNPGDGGSNPSWPAFSSDSANSLDTYPARITRLTVFETYYQRFVRGTYEQAQQFFRDVRSELRKVTFPSRKETFASTTVVIAVVFIIAIYLGIVDFILSLVLSYILK